MMRRASNQSAYALKRSYKQELDEQEVQFVTCYFAFGLDLGRAAREAGYTGYLASHPWDIARRPHVQQAIYERLQYEQLAAPELIQMVASLARADMRNYLRVEEYEETLNDVAEDGTTTTYTETHKRVVADLVHAFETGNTYPIKSVEFNRDGTVKKIILEDKQDAIRLLGAAFGLFGLDKSQDDNGESFRERMRNVDPKILTQAVMTIARQYGLALPSANVTIDDLSIHAPDEQLVSRTDTQ